MCKIILICGKIASGKTYYAEKLKKKYNAVILSTDEVTYDLIDNKQGKFYDDFAKKVNLYLQKKAIEIVRAGCNVILDWGFWRKKDRQEISKYFIDNKIKIEWYYIDIDDKTWEKFIEKRNTIMKDKRTADFYVDKNLKNKCLSNFEIPSKSEIDNWIYIE